MQENGVDCKSTGAYFYKLQNCMVPIKQNPYKLVCFHQFPFPCYNILHWSLNLGH